MFFWRRKETKEGEIKLPGPRSLPEPVGRFMVVDLGKSPDWVWNLKSVSRPAGEKKAFYCRVFDQNLTAQAGVEVKNWSSLDEHPELIIWEGHFSKKTYDVRTEKFVKPTNSSG